ncbi:hypothetical protein FHR99_002761 [Litorivivens lipolytica]|uniref:Metallo-beta-lactamase domain-containing protein n=1 Tax=Litorivivens lipolytica TaxID=1524264 RepID=A0A7W4W6S0_9GAMM|nr:hypothetical protein [Litorivivens lipolytica]MBB3048487.1 hypothetical protein [Litorivivens lipolytica]
MAEQIIRVSDDFWNIRGDFKIGGVLNIGTHTSLVRLQNGRFVFLDAYTLSGDIKATVDEITEKGALLDAIINLHPFHTVHVSAAHAMYPEAKLFGTRRHVEKFPDLPWQPVRVESEEFAAAYAEDFEFSIPAGVDFISSNENLHFSSVLAYHKASKTIHVDDTLMYLPLPGLIGKLRAPRVGLHPTLSRTLEKRAGAVSDFRNWAKQLAYAWGDAENLCAAHSATILREGDMAGQIRAALGRVEKTLKKHEKKYG